MVKKNITLTYQQDSWIKSRIDSGSYYDESEVIRELIQEQQDREFESPEEIAAIRAALIEGEESGICTQSVKEIWEEAKAKYQAQHG